MTFTEDLQTDLDSVFFSDFALTGEYNGVEIDYIETEMSDLNTDIPGFVLPVKTIMVKESDVEKPKAGDAVVIDETTYRVGAGIRNEGGVWIVPLARRVTPNA